MILFTRPNCLQLFDKYLNELEFETGNYILKHEKPPWKYAMNIYFGNSLKYSVRRPIQINTTLLSCTSTTWNAEYIDKYH